MAIGARAVLSPCRETLKRAMDLGLGVPLLILLLPLLGLVAVVSWLFIGPPMLFRQARAGIHGRPFEIVKFRTMRKSGETDEERLLPVGRALRSLSLDELPELWNVLKGEMSLVGPRPLLVRYLDQYDPHQARRHEVKPGMTGWAQVHGRNALTWEERFRLDVWYVDHWSEGLDIRILLRTLYEVVMQRGINAGAAATMPEFLGSGRGDGDRAAP